MQGTFELIGAELKELALLSCWNSVHPARCKLEHLLIQHAFHEDLSLECHHRQTCLYCGFANSSSPRDFDTAGQFCSSNSHYTLPELTIIRQQLFTWRVRLVLHHKLGKQSTGLTFNTSKVLNLLIIAACF